ncbi:oligopeptide/dipeptide ABC transporter ATP-binding protein [Paraburkholderia sp.]|uniref:ABC transporter ATP-binding protein n=1 Tax=Paraburkholderia sp. TaxID=1926495 RepID=UPI00239E793A|nr:oligopeptide/dipeptide ABC transporter ATP-binding protein [Paraburkholderia sp.]MDE1179338.1 ATP-binding cassette domain-containing protein [Paraburkholderia sp.]
MNTMSEASRTMADGAAVQPVLSFDRVCREFAVQQAFLQPKKVLHALTDVSFDVRPGEIVGIVGESGSGKSTLGRLALGMMPPTSGTVRYRGQDLSGLRGKPLRAVRRDLQMIFQDPNGSLNGRMTIEQSLLEPLALHKIGTRTQQRATIGKLLDVVGLPASVLQRYPHELSGGQKQRVVIARALTLQPKVLVADEAVAALDVSVKAQIVNLLLELRESLNLAILFVSHDLPIVQGICDRVLVLYLGRVMELSSRSGIQDGGLHPYTQALTRSSPVPDPTRRFDPRDLLAGEVPSPLNPPSGCVFHTRCPSAIAQCATAVPPLVQMPGHHDVACVLYRDATQPVTRA